LGFLAAANPLCTTTVSRRSTAAADFTDAIRSQLFGDEAIQGPWLFMEVAPLQSRCANLSAAAREGFTMPRMPRRHRREVIALARATGFTHITGLWLDTPVWLCLASESAA